MKLILPDGLITDEGLRKICEEVEASCVIGFNNEVISIPSDLELYSEPKASRSKNSQAIYLGERSRAGHGFLLQYLPRHSKTSKHFHAFTQERYHILGGESMLNYNGTNHFLKRGIFKIELGRAHQLITLDFPSLILIEMVGDPKGLSMEDHHYVAS